MYLKRIKQFYDNTKNFIPQLSPLPNALAVPISHQSRTGLQGIMYLTAGKD
jgi:hypothetical protein